MYTQTWNCCIVVLALFSCGISIHICTMMLLIYIPINSVQRFFFLHILCIPCYLSLFCNSHSNRYAVIFSCTFEFHFSNNVELSILHLSVGLLHVFFWKMSFMPYAHFSLILIFAIKLFVFLMYFAYSHLSDRLFMVSEVPFYQCLTQDY
jgi:hypothetical protein